MRTLTTPYSEEIVAESGETPEELEQELRFLVAAKLYEMGRVTSGRAAEMAGMDRDPWGHSINRLIKELPESKRDPFDAPRFTVYAE